MNTETPTKNILLHPDSPITDISENERILLIFLSASRAILVVIPKDMHDKKKKDIIHNHLFSQKKVIGESQTSLCVKWSRGFTESGGCRYIYTIDLGTDLDQMFVGIGPNPFGITKREFTSIEATLLYITSIYLADYINVLEKAIHSFHETEDYKTEKIYSREYMLHKMLQRYIIRMMKYSANRTRNSIIRATAALLQYYKTRTPTRTI